MRISESSLGMESAERRTFEAKTRMYRESFSFSNQESLDNANSQFDSNLRKQGIDPETVKKNSGDKKSGEEEKKLDNDNSGAGLSDSYFAWKNGVTTGKTLGLMNNASSNEDLLDKFRMSCLRMLLRIFYPNRLFETEDNAIGIRGINEDSSPIGISKTGINEKTEIGNPIKTSYILTKSVVEYSEYRFEESSFQSKGSVVTEDGRNIDFNINVAMSRTFTETITCSNESIREVMQFTDPLVVNFGNSVTQLEDQSFYFDIDNDGERDLIRQLTEGSGYLAFDKNEDGEINDGSELFGSSTGNGFDELAVYDQDNNGWIDENDDIFTRLKIWCRTATGENVLYTLKEAGVGAICLKNADTQISLGTNEKDTSAYIRKTGIFLYENGQAGTIQHVDMGKLA